MKNFNKSGGGGPFVSTSMLLFFKKHGKKCVKQMKYPLSSLQEYGNTL
jgi:hypothetical protein